MPATFGSFRIGSIRGIEIRVHWSWVVVFFFLAWTLEGGPFLSNFPEWSALQRWAGATVTTVLFFGSVLAHELAHAIVAQRFGIKVPTITLFAFGGVAAIASEMRSAGQEFRVAVAGPLMSWAIGLLSAGGWWLTQGTAPGTVLGYLAITNIVLGVFNLLPGIPLDGGRVLRAAVWAKTRNIMRATRVAARGGSVVAYGLVALGFLVLFTPMRTSGVWYVVIGFYLRSTARSSYREMMSDLVLRDIPARDLMLTPPAPVGVAMSLQTLVDERVVPSTDRAFLAERDGAIVGMLTITDIVRVPRARWAATSVQAVMIPVARVVTVSPETQLVEAMRLMRERDVHQLPVLEEGRLVGIVTRAEVLREIDMAMRRVEGGLRR
jgi:Zn-dependent protease/predicted transcriptional regulator